jgi:hypothetical protein
MAENKKEITIQKEDAVFWLDGQGFWHNRHGRFEHQKIVRHFHRSICLDDGGYHLLQDHGKAIEKVYFRYEDTALFVFEVITTDPMMLTLNTGKKLPLTPEKLRVSGDQLYIQVGDETAKFAERTLLMLAAFIDEEEGCFYYVHNGQRLPIAEDKT